MRVILVFLFVLILRAGEVRAQGAVEFHSATELRDALTGAAEAENGLAVNQIGNRGGYNYLIARRDKTGDVEVHASWDDFVVVQEGSAILRSGGTISGGSEATPGEHRGGTITGGIERRVAPGDVLVIPAGLPHQFVIEPGSSFTYLVVKIPGGSTE